MCKDKTGTALMFLLEKIEKIKKIENIYEKIIYFSWFCKHCTKTGNIPFLIRMSIGGFLSEDKILRADWTANNCTSAWGLWASSTSCSKSARANDLSNSSSSKIKIIHGFRNILLITIFNNEDKYSHYVFWILSSYCILPQ